jgi:predicted metal-dependent hydrolase
VSATLYPEQELKRRALRWSVTLRVDPRVIRIQRMTRKWGSCSSGGIVTFAEDLVAQDEPFQDYVIVHELLHFRIPTHGRLFKALMSAHVPGWRKMDELRAKRRSLSPPDSRMNTRCK